MVRFADNGDFQEIAGYLIEQSDGVLTLSEGDGQAISVGHWTVSDGRILVTPTNVLRDKAKIFSSGIDPLCKQRSFLLTKGGVASDSATYLPTSRLQVPEWDRYIRAAHEDGRKCGT
jgi:hypothetical protein